MFAVFGVSGRVFSGSLEQLRQVAPVSPAARVRALGVVEQDRAAPDASATARSETAPGGGTGAARGALAAYARTQESPDLRQPLTRVSDVMTASVVTLADVLPASEAWALLTSRGLAQAPVVNAAGVLIGMLLRHDLLPPGFPQIEPRGWRAAWARPVRELMVTPVPSVTADTELRRVASVLLDTGLPGLPVTDDQGQVTGFMGRADILRAVCHDPPLDLWG